jgi:hypothetical protein
MLMKFESMKVGMTHLNKFETLQYVSTMHPNKFEKILLVTKDVFIINSLSVVNVGEKQRRWRSKLVIELER